MTPPAHLPDNLSPDAVDTLSELTQILTRLRAAQSAGGSGSRGGLAASGTTVPSPAAGSAGPSTGSLAAGQHAPAPTSAPVTGTTPRPSTSANTAAGGAASSAAGGAAAHLLSLKDVPTATDNLKHKLQRARAAIRTLPDMARTPAQQGEELHELEGRIGRQREVLERLREMGLRFVGGGGEESEGGQVVEADEKMVM